MEANVVNVKDAMGTKYLIHNLLYDFETLIRSYKPGEVVFDLADCKFSPAVKNCLRNYEKDYEFINSKNSQLDTVLRYNHYLLTNDTSIKCDEVITLHKGLTDVVVKDILKGLDPNKTYGLNFKDTTDRACSFALILFMFAPHIKFALSGGCIYMLSFIQQYWDITMTPHQCYVVHRQGDTFDILNRMNDGYYKSQYGYEKYSFKQLQNMHYIASADIFNGALGQDNPEYRALVSKIYACTKGDATPDNVIKLNYKIRDLLEMEGLLR